MTVADGHLPPIISARAPDERGELIPVGIPRSSVEPLAGRGQREKLADLHGQIMAHRVLQTPYAIFQGLKRDMIAGDLDSFVYAYMTKPIVRYSYMSSEIGERLEASSEPANSVFAVYVTLNRDVIRSSLAEFESAGQELRGLVLG